MKSDLDIFWKIHMYKRIKFYEQSNEVLALRQKQKEKKCIHTNSLMNNQIK